MTAIFSRFSRFSYLVIYKKVMENVAKAQKRGLETLEPLNEAKKLKNEESGTRESKDLVAEESEAPVKCTAPSKSKKLALLLSYSGKGYFGMQINPGFRTVEGDLLNAMHKAGIISEECAQKPQLLHFQRASRTDKGVSAVRQVVSLKLPPQDDIVTKINEHLPPAIRVVAWKRTTRGFDSKNHCSSRTYSYMLPTFAFTPLTEVTNESYRISKEVMEEVNSLLFKFEGTHNFHNYTSQRKPNDPSCKRYIMSCKCGLPFILNDMEFAIVQMKGQSFMLHQIRKMIGLTIAISRGLAPPSVMVRAWGADRLDIPKAPGLGLMLENVHYEWYDERYGNDGLHESLQWDEHNDFIQKFKEQHILPTIVETEKAEKSMLNWLETLPFHTYDIRDSCAPYVYYTRSPLVCALNNVGEQSDKSELDTENNGNDVEDGQKAELMANKLSEDPEDDKTKELAVDNANAV